MHRFVQPAETVDACIVHVVKFGHPTVYLVLYRVCTMDERLQCDPIIFVTMLIRMHINVVARAATFPSESEHLIHITKDVNPVSRLTRYGRHL